MSRINKFFIFSLFFVVISFFGDSNISKVPDAILYSVDTVVPEISEYADIEQDILSSGRTVLKVSKKLIYLDNFYVEFLDILSPKVQSYPTIESPRILCGVKSFLHLLQLY